MADAPGDCPNNYLGQTETYVLNADGTRNSCANPAKLNSSVTIFLGGLGVAISGLYEIHLQLPASAQNGIVQSIIQINGFSAKNSIAIPVVP